MVCIAVTRNGNGDAWRFGSKAEAADHPLIQYGDVIADGPESLWDSYGRFDYPDLARFLSGHPRVVGLTGALADYASTPDKGREAAAKAAVAVVWDELVAKAKAPPSKPQDIIELIIADRKRFRTEGNPRTERVVRRQGSSVKQTAMATKEESDDMGEKREAFRMHDDGVITFGKDGEGKSYGPDNNPKRGENTSGKFAIYKEGMTVKQALEAGLSRSDIRRDRRKGFIEITNPVQAENAAAE